jgi:hypothetical protein
VVLVNPNRRPGNPADMPLRRLSRNGSPRRRLNPIISRAFRVGDRMICERPVTGAEGVFETSSRYASDVIVLRSPNQTSLRILLLPLRTENDQITLQLWNPPLFIVGMCNLR